VQLHPVHFGGIVGGIVIYSETGYPQMSLTNIAITKAKQADKPYKLSDGGGLYMSIAVAISFLAVLALGESKNNQA
tara:strand:- start:1528 stop:1755 length:228 start_codon:yes stop_codon:yes gene_type:complete